MNNTGKLATRDQEKAEEFDYFFASVFIGDCSTCSSWVYSLEGRYQGNSAPPDVSEDQIHDCLKNNIHKTMGPNEMYPWVPRELADIVVKLMKL